MQQGFLVWKKYRLLFVLSWFSVSIFLLLTQYGLGSMRVDGSNPNPGLRDLETYVNAGNAILSRENPYSSTIVRMGPIAALPFGFLDNVLSFKMLFVIWQFFIICCYIFLSITFIRFVQGKTPNISNALISTTPVLWFSSLRENLVTNQVNALIALYFGFFLLYLSKSNKTLLFRVFIVMFSVFVIDLKPHLTLIPILLLLIRSRMKIELISIFLFYLMANILVSVFCGVWLQKLWFLNILNSPALSTQKLSDANAFWPFIRLLGVDDDTIPILSVVSLIFATITLLLCRKKLNTSTYFQFCLMLPTLFIYYHFYDLALPAVTFFSFLLTKDRSFQAIGFCLGMFLWGTSAYSGELALVALVSALFIFLQFGVNKIRNFGFICLGLLTSRVLEIVTIPYLPEELRNSFKISYSCVAIFLLILFYSPNYKLSNHSSLSLG